MGPAPREMGGYFELEHFEGREYHEGALALNCARHCLSYLIEARGIASIWTPAFLCDSVDGACLRHGVAVKHFEVLPNFEPDFGGIDFNDGDYLYIVDYYGQLSEEAILKAAEFAHGRLIVDEVMAFFRKPLEDFDTIYSCRKFFGVADGAYLYTSARIERNLGTSQSHDKMDFVLARAELPANDYYPQSAANNKRFTNEEPMWMSPITHNILRAVDYAGIAARRKRNFLRLAEQLDELNELSPRPSDGAFMYPLLVTGGNEIRTRLQQDKIYVSKLWGRAIETHGWSKRLADDVLPLICDQRYGTGDMDYEIAAVKALLEDR